MFTSTVHRPRVRAPRTMVDHLLETLAAAMLIATAVMVTAQYSQLPDRIPIHFDIAGKPDGYGSRGNLVALVGVIAAVYAVLTGVSFLPPWYWNLPTRVTERNAGRVYGGARRMLLMLKLEIVLLFGVLIVMVIRAAHVGTGLSVWFLPVTLGVIFATVIGWTVALMRIPK